MRAEPALIVAVGPRALLGERARLVRGEPRRF